VRVVLDTNVLLSALIAPGSVPDGIYRAWEDGRFSLVTSEWQLDELRRATRYPKLRKYIRPREAGTLVRGISREAVVLRDPPAVELAPDPDDDPLLATTLTGEADYLVTGDRGLLGLERVGRARILEARVFLEDVLRLTG
jgi:putative PIN family toxin of toxin-antitoxin system